MPDIMLNLETMDTAPTAAIVAIGAVEMDFETGEILLGKGFYSRVDLKSSVEAGGTMGPSTVLWWLQQSNEARAELYDEPLPRLSTALCSFTSWINSRKSSGSEEAARVRIWGNGAGFDNIILRNAFKNAGLMPPWNYRDDRCYRTMKNLYSQIKLDRNEPKNMKHRAFKDACFQATHLIEIMRVLNGGGERQ